MPSKERRLSPAKDGDAGEAAKKICFGRGIPRECRGRRIGRARTDPLPSQAASVRSVLPLLLRTRKRDKNARELELELMKLPVTARGSWVFPMGAFVRRFYR